MKTLEIIHLRLAATPPENLSEQIRQSIAASKGSDTKITVYRRGGLETDIAIHIHHHETPGSGPKSPGLYLASELKSYGLVQHTFWEQLN